MADRCPREKMGEFNTLRCARSAGHDGECGFVVADRSAPAVKERPILFQGAMVRALLAGTKTQTRRVVADEPPEEATVYAGTVGTYSGLSVERHYWKTAEDHDAAEAAGTEYVYWPGADDDGFAGDVYGAGGMVCPYGQPENCLLPASRLWVRETFFAFGRWETRFSAKKGRDEWHFVDMTLECGKVYSYAADGAPHDFKKGNQRSSITPAWWKRPAIFMPRAASRILLEVTGVSVERLQAISEADAIAEGIERKANGKGYYDPGDIPKGFTLPHAAAETYQQVQDRTGIHWATAREAYRSLWTAINGADSWDRNDWVWVVEFRKVHA